MGRNMSSSNNKLLVLDLPPRTQVTLFHGCSTGGVSSRIVPRDDFCGIVNLPSNSFHLLTVRVPPPKSSRSDSHSQPPSVTSSGLITFYDDDTDNNNDVSVVARRYDFKTEEFSTLDVLKECYGLVDAIQTGRIHRHRVLRFDEFVLPKDRLDSHIINNSHSLQYSSLCGFITQQLLIKRGLYHGCKVLAAAYIDNEDQDITNNDETKAQKQERNDGVYVTYPPIACITPGIRITLHPGTKRYLSQLSPSERTNLFLMVKNESNYHHDSCNTEDDNDATKSVGLRIATSILRDCYENDWGMVLGDLQLSFVLFMGLGCLASFEHWRDVISMLSLIPPNNNDDQHTNTINRDVSSPLPLVFKNILPVILHQMQSVDNDFFQEVEISGNNFFVPAMERICQLSLNFSDRMDNNTQHSNNCNISTKNNENNMQASVQCIKDVFFKRFGVRLLTSSTASIKNNTKQPSLRKEVNTNEWCCDDDPDNEKVMRANSDDEDDMENEAGDISGNRKSSHPDSNDMGYVDDDDDEDGPTIVSMEEVTLSHSRSLASSADKKQQQILQQQRQEYCAKYPLLFASIISPGEVEDVVMTCARILDDDYNSPTTTNNQTGNAIAAANDDCNGIIVQSGALRKEAEAYLLEVESN